MKYLKIWENFSIQSDNDITPIYYVEEMDKGINEISGWFGVFDDKGICHAYFLDENDANKYCEIKKQENTI